MTLTPNTPPTVHTDVVPLNPAGLVPPGAPFMLFGMGGRRKMLYREGALLDARTGDPLARWDATAAHLDPAGRTVELDTPAGPVRVWEDDQALWLDEAGTRRPISEGAVPLPNFEGHPYAALLRALLHELLVNVVDGAPLPNLLVYDRPWYRDAAMVALVFERTGHLGLIRDWVLGLRAVYDRNNAGHEEPDNLGQLLTLIALVSGTAHPLVPDILAAARSRSEDGYLRGLSDFAEHPVYQTKWLKYGLARLGLPDPYHIPAVPDSYSALFWMEYRDQHVPSPAFSDHDREFYPYLAWAAAHFHGEPAPFGLAARGSPLTWEAQASEARYEGLRPLGEAAVAGRRAAPHTWHAAEMFLYLHDRPEQAGGP